MKTRSEGAIGGEIRYHRCLVRSTSPVIPMQIPPKHSPLTHLPRSTMEGTRIALALPAPPIINRNSAKAAVGSRQQTQIAADSFSQRGLLSREVPTRSLRSLLGLVLAKELAQTRSLWSLLSHGIQARSLNGACSDCRRTPGVFGFGAIPDAVATMTMTW